VLATLPAHQCKEHLLLQFLKRLFRRKSLRLHEYTLFAKIGKGGYASVYQGVERKTQKKVAVKIFDGGMYKKSHTLNNKQVKREVELLKQIEHPYIIPIEAVGQIWKYPYIVMPLAEMSLRDYSKGRLLSVQEVLSVLPSIVEALQFLHYAGYVHCDVKERNCLLIDGKWVLSDFGLTVPTGTKKDGMLGGTAQFMPIEQFEGLGVPACDQFALGVVIYRLLSEGKDPYGIIKRTGEGLDEAFKNAHRGYPLSFSEQGVSVPTTVEQVIFRALSPDYRERFPSVEVFFEALKNAFETQ
jgi:serine/threonine-protein kinase